MWWSLWEHHKAKRLDLQGPLGARGKAEAQRQLSIYYAYASICILLPGSPGTNQSISNIVLSNHCLPRTVWGRTKTVRLFEELQDAPEEAKGECSHTAW